VDEVDDPLQETSTAQTSSELISEKQKRKLAKRGPAMGRLERRSFAKRKTAWESLCMTALQFDLEFYGFVSRGTQDRR
jgi:hypothetical protein